MFFGRSKVLKTQLFLKIFCYLLKLTRFGVSFKITIHSSLPLQANFLNFGMSVLQTLKQQDCFYTVLMALIRSECFQMHLTLTSESILF